jgi:hypothetical protein
LVGYSSAILIDDGLPRDPLAGKYFTRLKMTTRKAKILRKGFEIRLVVEEIVPALDNVAMIVSIVTNNNATAA